MADDVFFLDDIENQFLENIKNFSFCISPYIVKD